MPSIASLSILLIMMSITAIFLNKSHLLLSLLSLELMILGLLLMFSTLTMKMNPSESLSLLIILTFGACEASLGLAILVFMARSYGNDHLFSSTMSKF